MFTQLAFVFMSYFIWSCTIINTRCTQTVEIRKYFFTVLYKMKLYSNPAALYVYSLCGFEFKVVRMLWYAIYMFYSRQGEV